MSWSLTLIGKTDNIVKALKEQSDKLSGGSKVEFDAALPHLVGLVEQNFNATDNPVMQIQASGHGHDNYRQCTVTLSFLGGQLV
jgi:hypothetical protein